MNNRIVNRCAVMLATLALIAGAAVAQVQAQSDQSSAQTTTSHRQGQQADQQHNQPAAHSGSETTRSETTRPETTHPETTHPETATRNGAQTDHNRETARSHEARPAAPARRVASADQGTLVARYHRAHPHAAARCHDGFFTNTTDRGRACSKHGGIDIWLLP